MGNVVAQFHASLRLVFDMRARKWVHLLERTQLVQETSKAPDVSCFIAPHISESVGAHLRWHVIGSLSKGVSGQIQNGRKERERERERDAPDQYRLLLEKVLQAKEQTVLTPQKDVAHSSCMISRESPKSASLA